MRIKVHAQNQYSLLTHFENWSRLEVGTILGPLRAGWNESVLAVVRFSSMICPTAHSTTDLEPVAIFLLGNAEKYPFCPHLAPTCFHVLHREGALVTTSFHSRWKSQPWCHQVTITKVSMLISYTSHTPCKAPHPPRGLRWKIAYWWYPYCVLLVSSSGVLPSIYGYCKLLSDLCS